MIRKSKLFKKDMEESQKIYEKQVKNYNEIVAVSKKKNDLISERDELGKKEFLKMLDEKKVVDSPLKIQKINGIDNLNEGFKIFKKIASNFELNENFSVVRLSPKKRAHFIDRTNTINITSKESLSTILHELVHGLENNPYVLKQSVDFFNKRTAGKPIRKLNEINPAYRENELFKEGDFFNPYVGKFNEANSGSFKQYKGLRSTEILTMGVERMLKNPYSFQKEDKEYFEFIYNLLMKDL